MTEQIKNLFKHKIPFHSRRHDIREHGIYTRGINIPNHTNQNPPSIYRT